MVDKKTRRQLAGDLDNIARKALEKDPRRRYSSVEHLEVASSLHTLGMVQTAAGRPREGGAAWGQALAVRRKLLAETDWKIADSTVQLGVCMTAQGRHSEAKPLFEEGYRRVRDALGQNHPRTIHARERLNGLERP